MRPLAVRARFLRSEGGGELAIQSTLAVAVPKAYYIGWVRQFKLVCRSEIEIQTYQIIHSIPWHHVLLNSTIC